MTQLRGAVVPSWIAAYVSLVLVWGSAFVFMRLALDSLTPVGLAVSRCCLAAATLIVISLLTRSPFPPRTAWPRLAIYGVMTAAMPWVTVSFAIQHIPTSLAAIIGSSSALWVLVIILLFFREERPSPQRVIGLLIGFAGILVVLGVWQGVSSGPLAGIALMTTGLIVFAFSLPYSRRHLAGGSRSVDLSPISVATGALVFAAIASLPMLLFVDVVSAPMELSSVVGVAGVGVLASGLGTVLMLSVVRQTDATTASTATYFVPLVALVLGVTAMGERLAWNELVGGALILFGAALAQDLLSRRGTSSPKLIDSHNPRS